MQIYSNNYLAFGYKSKYIFNILHNFVISWYSKFMNSAFVVIIFITVNRNLNLV